MNEQATSINNNVQDIPVPGPNNTPPRGKKRSVGEQVLRVIDDNTKESVDQLQVLTNGETDLLREMMKSDKELQYQQRKADYMKYQPRTWMLSGFILSLGVFALLCWALPSPQAILDFCNACKDRKLFGYDCYTWMYRLTILLPMACSVSMIAKFSIFRDFLFGLQDAEINDKVGRLIFSVFEPSNAKYEQHAYTASEIYDEIAKHHNIPANITVAKIRDYLLNLWKVDHNYKKLKDCNIVFYLKLKKLIKPIQNPKQQANE